MATSDTLLALAISEFRPSCRGEPDLRSRVEKAMVVAQSFWLSTDADVRLRGAIGAALAETSDAGERRRLEVSIKQLWALSSMLHSVPVDTDAVLKEAEGVDVLPLMGMWYEVTGRRGK